MTEAKPTPGPWKHIPWHIEEGPPAVRAPDGSIVCTTASEDDAALVAEAGTVHHETGLTPRQLAEQRAELLDALHAANVVIAFGSFCEKQQDPLNEVKARIQKALERARGEG